MIIEVGNYFINPETNEVVEVLNVTAKGRVTFETVFGNGHKRTGWSIASFKELFTVPFFEAEQ